MNNNKQDYLTGTKHITRFSLILGYYFKQFKLEFNRAVTIPNLIKKALDISYNIIATDTQIYQSVSYKKNKLSVLEMFCSYDAGRTLLVCYWCTSGSQVVI